LSTSLRRVSKLLKQIAKEAKTEEEVLQGRQDVLSRFKDKSEDNLSDSDLFSFLPEEHQNSEVSDSTSAIQTTSPPSTEKTENISAHSDTSDHDEEKNSGHFEKSENTEEEGKINENGKFEEKKKEIMKQKRKQRKKCLRSL